MSGGPWLSQVGVNSAAAGYQFIGLNYFENNPRQSIITPPTWIAGDNIISLDGTNGVTIPTDAKFVRMGFTIGIKTTGTVGTFQALALHSMYDNPGTIYCESGRFGGIEWVGSPTIAIGTVYVSGTQELVVPVLTGRTVNISIVTLPAGGVQTYNVWVHGYYK